SDIHTEYKWFLGLPPSSGSLSSSRAYLAARSYETSTPPNFPKAPPCTPPTDIRGEWFLGIHQCQSLQVVDGMNRLLSLEDKFKNLPADFWDDYITCASVAVLPAHTRRAIDHAVASGQP